ncbi:MAG: S-methyl-5-thioribose-1-phosphate isomerase [Lentisphaerae bacterium GWF2_49_21]|nr:MAG: S-methyl-5-thioribose-1-phosphate isomerase [Lentisphaerae bacterium GWF2_49_21]
MNSERKIFPSSGKFYKIFLPGKLRLIDQTMLPEKLIYLETDDRQEIFDYIKRLVVRGAPAIGCAAGLGLAAVSQHSRARKVSEFVREIRKTADYLASSRPTAVNLSWALNRTVAAVEKSTADGAGDVSSLKLVLLMEALEIVREDVEMCKSIGQNGVRLLKNGMGILTHCNAGALATADYGTALSPIYAAHEKGMKIKVYSDETRPLLQGSRLTAWELKRAGVDVTTICDNMAAQVMREGKINLVIVGADRIAANGDAANKIGTYGVAILAKYHKIPFYIAAPYSTVDISIRNGSGIPIEERNGDEIRRGFGRLTAPSDVTVYNPAFDVTPNELITGIITEKGIIRTPFRKNIMKMLGNKLHS